MALQPEQGVLGRFDPGPLGRGFRHRAPGREHVQLAEHLRADGQGLRADHLYLHGRLVGFQGRRGLELCLVAYGY